MSRDSVDHLERAKVYIGKGEEYYRRAAEEILAAMNEDPTLSYREVAAAIGRDKSWVHKIVQWSTSVVDDNCPTPFSEAAGKPNRDESGAKKMIRERPEFVAEAIAKADPETQRKIAAAIVKAEPEAPLADAVAPPIRKPAPGTPAWRRLEKATFTLWEVGQDLMDQAPTGEQKVRMLASAQAAERLASGISMLLGSGEVDDAFRDLLGEMEGEVV